MSKSAGLFPVEFKDVFPVLKVAMHGRLVVVVAEKLGVLVKREKCLEISEALLESMVLKTLGQIY